MRIGRKGVSEVVAAMMLITITVSAALILYVYSSGLLGSLQVQPQQGQYSNQITLEFYDWTNPGTLSLTLRNVGSGLGIIAAFYVNGKAVSMKSGTCTTTSSLQPQGSCSASLDTSKLSLSAGVAFIVKVTTKDGGIFSFSCISGQRTGSIA